MDYKKYLEDNLKILSENSFDTKRKYLNYLDSLKKHQDVIIPDDNIIYIFDNNDDSSIYEYAISNSGGDSSDIDMDEINIFIKRIKNGYNLIKYIEEINNN